MSKPTAPKTPVELFIFDLDGTLIESKWDIATSVNLTLADLGLPQRPQEEIFGFVGDGVKRLLRLAVGEENQAAYEQALAVFRGHYLTHCLDRTRFYPGVEKVLAHFADTRSGATPIHQGSVGCTRWTCWWPPPCVCRQNAPTPFRPRGKSASDPDWFIDRPEDLIGLFV